MDGAPADVVPPPPPDPATELERPKRDPPAPLVEARLVAFFEVLLCSDYPSQLALGVTFALLGFRPQLPDGRLNASYVVALSLIDTLLLTGLILLFLRTHGERARDVFLGDRPVWREIRTGAFSVIGALGLAIAVLAVLQRFAPTLHNVPYNPLQDLIRTPGGALVFAIVVIVAGGLREELQRAFILHRFERWLGGPVVGLVVTSVAFGAGHGGLQGSDAAVATGTLGAFWGVLYLTRRSAVAPIISHAGFDVLQIVVFGLSS